MTSIQRQWEDFVAELLTDEHDLREPGVRPTVRASYLGFGLGVRAALTRLAEGATLLEIAQELEEFADKVGPEIGL